jgi:heme-degrading monooxygenase HmoA
VVFEVATIEVKAGLEQDFESGVAAARPVFQRAKGCRSMRLERSIENPLRYRLVVEWDSIEDHIVGFRNSADFETWRSFVGHTFAAPPAVEHTTIVLSGFGKDREA